MLVFIPSKTPKVFIVHLFCCPVLQIHYYQPLWTLVGAGIYQTKDSGRPMSEVVPRNVNFISDRLVKLEPDLSRVHLSSGKQVNSVVVKLFIFIAGAQDALDHDPRVISNYSLPHLDKTFKAYQAFQGGYAMFTLPCDPIKCAGAPQKVMYLFEDYLRRHGLRDKADIHYFTSLSKMFTVDKYSDSLKEVCRQRNIHTHLQQHLVEYDLLHITPPMAVPEVLKYIRLFYFISWSSLCSYDGYTACPLVTSYSRGIMAEFDYSCQPLETLPLDQSKERYIHYFMKAVLMPPLYWDWFVHGYWSGPKVLRKILHLGFSK
ncbi:unnamed protein product [Echinostoma caproni]|uniref:Sulfide:quinone oxidoreductase, mitochondrial n=1 Tax=Echinostoma caproni TaxID=27848 RepID=A0A3P8JSS8_9TREM|nr:unnamed protein product [Echinostoma caproni]